MFGLAVLFGGVVGFALGLTGGGGGVFAVPLLVYGLSVAPREAIGVSLASVGGTALLGAAPRLGTGQVEIRTGLLFAVAGMVGAPMGACFASLVPETLLLVLFACLMLVVAQRMWSKSSPPAIDEAADDEDRQACRRDADGRLRLTSRCARLLIVVGLLTGVLSGMFGVGGGFVIVPSLVLFSGMSMHKAVGTSLFVIALVSASGLVAHYASGARIALDLTLQFLVGGLAGMGAGGLVAGRLNGPTLQKTFAVAIVAVAAFVIVKSTLL